MTSQEADRFSYVRRWNSTLSNSGWWHSFELPDGSVVQGVNDLASLQGRLAKFPIPADLKGKRVLDIGAWDGWFSFEMERRGADVVAIDCWENARFWEMHSIYNSRVEYRVMDVYDITPQRLGMFDIVLFMGVLYHLKHPLLALERVCSVTRDLAAVDSFVLREQLLPGQKVDQRCLLEFYETTEFGGQTDNWCGPTVACLEAFCRTAGFARVERRGDLEHSACLACWRAWEPPAADAAPGPELRYVFHTVNMGINVSAERDDSIGVGFVTPEADLTIHDLQPDVAGYGVRPIEVKQREDHWIAAFRTPPGLAAGWHDVNLRVRGGRPGNALRIAVDIPAVTEGLAITGICDGVTWTPGRLDLSRGDVVAIWIAGLSENADRGNIRVELDGLREPCEVLWVQPFETPSPLQVNVRLPKRAAAGKRELAIRFGGAQASVPLVIT